MSGYGTTGRLGHITPPGTPQTPYTPLAGPIQNQPKPADLSAYYAQMTKALQDSLAQQQQMYGQMQQSQQQYNNLIDPNITTPYYAQLTALQKQLQAMYDPNIGLAQHEAMMQQLQPVKQQSRSYILQGY